MLSSLYVRLGIAAALAFIVGYGVWAIRDSGVQACEQKHAVVLAESIQRAAAQARALALQDAEVSEYYEKWRTKVIVRNVVEEVTREIPADCMRCGLGPDGLRKLNEIRRGDTPADARKPDVRMPTPASPYDGLTPGARWLLSPGQPHVQRLRDETQASDPAGQSEGI